MAYHLYITEGVILKSTVTGESDRTYAILTKDLGLINASGKAVRKQFSKLKFGLGDLMLSEISLIRGKVGWRITNAISKKDYFEFLRVEREKLGLASRVFRLLKSLVAGEEKNVRLFEIIIYGLNDLTSKIQVKDLILFESIWLLRILNELGYVEAKKHIKPLVDNLGWDDEIKKGASDNKKMVLKSVNEALKATQLL